MEERKLNLNIPLLSVRRSSTPTKSAPTKPSSSEKGKKNNNSQPDRRRTLPSCKPSYILEQVTKPVAVPFQWEKIPGRPKDGTTPDSQCQEVASVTPKIPRKALDSIKHIENKKPEGQDIISKSDCSREEENEKAIIKLELEDNNDDDDDDVYSDALDTLSLSESISVNCSVSGVSGFDVVKSSGAFSTDPQSRDFMMNRFLPAAKAMTLEPPHYASRKQPVSGEQPRPIIVKDVQRDTTPPIIRNVSQDIAPYHQDEEDDDESEDECDEYSVSGNITAKGCGFLPRLCMKNSLCLLNPVPGMKVRTQSSTSTSWDVKKLTKAVFSRSQSPLKKPGKDASSKQKVDKEASSPRLVGFENKLTGGSNRFSHAADRQMISRTSPFRRSSCNSPCRNEAPQSPLRGRGFQGIPKDLENFKTTKLSAFSKGYSKSQELVPYTSFRRGSRPSSPIVEKTLYVDSVNAAGILCSKSGPLDIKKGFVDSAEKDLKSLFKEIAVVKSSFRDVKCLDVPTEDAKLQPLIHPSAGHTETTEDLSADSKALVCLTLSTEDSVNIQNDQIPDGDDTGIEKTSLVLVQGPPPPLLPKTPSESWLCRTLPSISSQHQSTHLHRGTSFQSKRQDPKTSTAATKWENIVKSSYLHHDHVRYSEELRPHTSQQSKS